jgi:hypothetical protein
MDDQWRSARSERAPSHHQLVLKIFCKKVSLPGAPSHARVAVLMHDLPSEFEMKALSWINFILGLWLIVAGFTLSAASRPVMGEEIVLGIIIAVLAAISAARPSTAISWLVAIAGLWTLVAPAVISYAGMNVSRTNDIVVGIVVLVLGIANALYRRSPVRTQA